MTETCYIDETQDELQQFVRQEELRQCTRHDASLSFSIDLIGAETGSRMDEPPQLVSHTSDVGAGGMALLVPSLPFMYRYLLTPDCTLRFTLHLPDEPIQIEAIPVYDRPLNEEDESLGFMVSGRIEIESTPRQYERYEKDGPEMGCLIGVRIKKMNDQDRERYQEYLDILELERNIKILTDEDEAASSDEMKSDEPSPQSFAQAASTPYYHTAAPYEYS
ncbi:MAG TPA: hypothetical protein VIW80_19785 [Pyrinomonadaceae bacterium]|jgi:hypothetical protein